MREVAAFESVADVSETSFDTIMNINLKGAFFTVQHLLPLINDGGTIILLSSVNAYSGMPGASVYSASKAGLNSLGRTLSRELASRKIRVNIVNPGPVATPIFEKSGIPKEAINEEQMCQVITDRKNRRTTGRNCQTGFFPRIRRRILYHRRRVQCRRRYQCSSINRLTSNKHHSCHL